MAYTKEAKTATSYNDVSKETDSWKIHLFPALLCEDGTYLLQETGNRINLEWHDHRIIKDTASFSKVSEPATVWTK